MSKYSNVWRLPIVVMISLLSLAGCRTHEAEAEQVNRPVTDTLGETSAPAVPIQPSVELVTSYYTDSIYRIEEAKGAAMLRQVEETIKTFFPKGRFPFQRDQHNQVLRATLRQTLGSEYEASVEKVCRERGWKGPKKNRFAIASRHSGKTTAMASIVAHCFCIPNIQIVVYSGALRTAQEFVRLVERYIQMHPVGKPMIANPGGSETLVLKGPNHGDERRIRSFPSGGNAKN